MIKFNLQIFILLLLAIVSNLFASNNKLQFIQMKEFNFKLFQPYIKQKYQPAGASIKEKSWIFLLQKFQSNKAFPTMQPSNSPFFIRWLTLPLKDEEKAIRYYLKKGFVPFDLFEKNKVSIGVAFYKTKGIGFFKKCNIDSLVFDLHSDFMQTSLVHRFNKVIHHGHRVVGISAKYDLLYYLDCELWKSTTEKLKKAPQKWFLGYYSDVRKMHRDLKERLADNWLIRAYHFGQKISYLLFVKP